MIHFNTVIFLIGKFSSMRFNVKFLAMIQLLLLSLFDPVIDGPNFSIALLDGHIDPMSYFIDHHHVLLINWREYFVGGINKFKWKQPSSQV